MTSPGTPQLWRSAGWLAEATGWIDAVLADHGARRTGPVTQPRVRPWGTVLTAMTGLGAVWLKAPAQETAFEVALYPILMAAEDAADDAAIDAPCVLSPLAVDVDRGWLLLPGGPPTLRDAEGDPGRRAAGLARALLRYGELQRRLMPHVDSLLAAGVADMRPAVLPQRFDEALETPTLTRGSSAEDRDVQTRLRALAPQIQQWADIASASAVVPSLDHNDLHDGNVLQGDDGRQVFMDWGDSVVAHPFAVMLVTLKYIAALLEVAEDDPAVLAVRDDYLAAFDVDGEDVVATCDVVVHLSWIARALVWERGLRAAHRAGEDVQPEWARAPLECLVALLSPGDGLAARSRPT